MKTLTRKLGFSLTALLPLVLLSATGAQAQEQADDPAIYSCSQCVRYTGWSGTLDFGFNYLSDESLRFADYRGLDEDGIGLAVDGELHYRSLKGWYFDLYAVDSMLDNRQFDARGGKRDSFEFRVGWQNIPKYRGYGTQTPFLDVGSDNLSLPLDWVYAPTTDQMTALQSSLAEAALKTERKTFDTGATVQLGRHWSYRVDYQRQKKEGTRRLGGGLFNAAIMPAPVDFTTDILDMALGFASKRAQLQVGLMRSYFDNGNASLTWRNPFGSRPNNYYLRAALEPDNKLHQFSVSGALVITPRIRLSAQGVMGEMSQNDPFLPYSTNPSFNDLVLPRESLKGKLDASTYNFTGKLFARLSNSLSFTARGKWDERENKTPVDLYETVTVDFLQQNDRYNRPYGYEREKYSADLRYRAGRHLRFAAGGEQENMERTLQAVERSEETTFWGEAKLTAMAGSQLRFKLESAGRDVEDYLQPDDGGPVDHPLMRKFNQADRDRERLLIDLDFMPSDALGVNLSFFRAQSDYTESMLGLQESEEESYTLNLNYAIGSKGNLYAFVTRDNIDARMLNATASDADPWNARTADEITTLGLGFSTQINEKSSIGIDYVSSDSTGEIVVQATGEEDPFTQLKTDLANTKLYFNHAFSERVSLKLYAEYEEYSSRDWAIDGYGVDGIGSILTMGEESPDYDVWYFRVQASYRF